jgi:hypothetical protein
MAKYVVTSGVCLGAGRDVYPGDIVELTDQELARLGTRRFRPATPDDEKKAPAGKSKPVETRAPDVTTR